MPYFEIFLDRSACPPLEYSQRNDLTRIKEVSEIKEFITEPGRRLEVSRRAGVVIAGGGVAGISAAIAAARGGADVVLLEREYCLGGMATLGLITIYLPLDDGMGNQVTFGISEELLRLSIEHGAEANYPKAWLEGGDARGAEKIPVHRTV